MNKLFGLTCSTHSATTVVRNVSV